MADYFLGIDIGGTKSHALITDELGHRVGFAEVGAGNYETVGWSGLRRVLRELVNQAIARAGITLAQLSGVGFGIAGYDWPGERAAHCEIIASLGLQAPYALVNDALIGLIAGASEGWGVGVVSGTGSNCWGRDRQGREGRVTGGGEWFGEHAGGSDLVAWAVRAVAESWTQRGPATQLETALIARAGAKNLSELLEGIYLGRYEFTASDAPLVFRVANAGDAVAEELVRHAGRELGSLAIGVIRQLSLEREEFEVVQIGSMFNGSPLLTETMLTVIHAVAPGAKPVRLESPPVVGGVLLGMEQVGLPYSRLRAAVIEAAKCMHESAD